MDLALRVLDIGDLSITRLLAYRLDSAETSHFKNAFFSERGGFETFLKGLVERFPAAVDCVSLKEDDDTRWAGIWIARGNKEHQIFEIAEVVDYSRCVDNIPSVER